MFRVEMPQIIPAFGQAHGHLAYDDATFKTVFLRPVMQSSRDKSLKACQIALKASPLIGVRPCG